MVIRIGHINAQRSAAAAANIEILIKERNLDILCLLEPFYFEGKVITGLQHPELNKITTAKLREGLGVCCGSD